MKNTIEFKRACSIAKQIDLSFRQRLDYDELEVLCRIMYDKTSYMEVGVYDGLSAFIIGMCTKAESITLIDNNFTEKANTAANILSLAGINIQVLTCDALEAQTDYHSWCLLDADHSYKSTKACYERFKDLTGMIVLHDVEMLGPGQLFAEVGGIKIVSSKEVISPDTKVLPKMGYGILFKHE